MMNKNRAGEMKTRRNGELGIQRKRYFAAGIVEIHRIVGWVE